LKIQVSGVLRHRVMEVTAAVDAGNEHGKE
jgi:hypothetical protein